jgi:hypothetical protein
MKRIELTGYERQRRREAPLRELDVAASFLEPFGRPTEGGDEFEVCAAEQLPPTLARGVAEGRR